jgi:CBS domain containing-hemolysin-like protein
MPVRLYLILLSILFSAFFSGSELALTSVRRITLEVWRKQRKRGAKQALEFIQRPERFLSTTLVGTNIAVITASSLLAVSLEPYMSGFAITLISTVGLLFLGEIIPKSIARQKSAFLTVYASYILRGVYILFYPLNRLVLGASRLLLLVLGVERTGVKRFFTRKDMDMLVRESERMGLVDKKEQAMISRMLLKGNQKIREIMVHRTEMITIKTTDSIQKAFHLLETSGYSRLPVMKKDVDHITGIITARDLILHKPARISQILRDILFVPESRLVASLFREMQRKGCSIAVVVDEYGGTAGLVTMEDIMEEFFGEIRDEYDRESRLYRKINPLQIDVHALVEIDELNERFHLELPDGDYNTLGGLILNRLKHIPKRGESVTLPTCVLVVLSAYQERIGWVRIRKKLGLLNPEDTGLLSVINDPELV